MTLSRCGTEGIVRLLKLTCSAIRPLESILESKLIHR